MTRIGLIWAEAADGIIGAQGGMPWHVPEDLAHFKEITTGHPVVMGRRTWDSLPPRFRPLPGRRNLVVTRQDDWNARGAERAASVDEALASQADADWVWVIGGGQIFGDVIDRADRLEITELDLTVAGDTVAPDRAGWSVVDRDPAEGWHRSAGGVAYRFLRLERST